ncbi:MAG: calycin-like domain-containing protein [Bacteroidaceae bacterium]|nr:calycin-like domain-containing protein [Bacteroidaceae bacterium]
MKRKLAFLLLMCCTLWPMASCSSDDNNDPTIDSNVVGTYSGPMSIAINGQLVGEPVNHSVIISKSTDKSSVKLSIADFSFGTLNLGTITIDGCKCDYANHTFSLSATSTVTISLGTTNLTCPTKVTGTVVDKTTTLNLDITVPGLNQAVTVTFSGTRP